MTELVFIKLFLSRVVYTTYRNYIASDMFEDIDETLLECVDQWYQNNDEGDPTLEDVYFLALPKVGKDDLVPVFRNLRELEAPQSASTALKELRTKRLLEDISMAALEASTGVTGASERLATYQEQLRDTDAAEEVLEEDFYTEDMTAILESTDRSGGLQWRLAALNTALGGLLPGDFGFILARPETGKTTMLASEATFMVEQLKEGDGPVIWFTNEEGGNKVAMRLRMAALGATDEAVRGHPKRAAQAYEEKTKGKLRLVDSDPLSKEKVERICAKHKPRLIILDQIDPITGFKADREDLKLGALYNWARTMAKNGNMSVIAVCQASDSGTNKRYLQMSDVADAKTSKQAKADWICGIGKLHDPMYESVRFLSLMKNKLKGKHSELEVKILPEIARYEDL